MNDIIAPSDKHPELEGPYLDCECTHCLKKNVARLQDLLDNRPANNAGIAQTYPQWNSAVYNSDIGLAVKGPIEDAMADRLPGAIH